MGNLYKMACLQAAGKKEKSKGFHLGLVMV
jgi:hypothetical protein